VTQEPARIAIDLGAESCRVSLLRWNKDSPSIEVIHRIPNGPVHVGDTLRWPLDAILSGLEEGLRKAAQAAPEGIASIAVDSWSVDYVRLTTEGQILAQPYCYRDERTIAAKQAADDVIAPQELFQRTGALPLRINTVYQLLADPVARIDPFSPWAMMPEFVLYWLGAPRVAEYTNASHTGLVNLKTGDWDGEVFREFNLPLEAAPPIVQAGTPLGPLQGPLASLDAFRETQLIAPACHDTASAIAGIPADLGSTAYICSGTWSLVGTLTKTPVTTAVAFNARYTNLGAATGDLCFHTLVNGMWIVKQCMDDWNAKGRAWNIENLIRQATTRGAPGTIDVDAESLLLDSAMPQRINEELKRAGFEPIADIAGNEPTFARVIFESLASRYTQAFTSLQEMLGRKLERVHILGGASRNQLLTDLTAVCSGLPVEIGQPESSTTGNLAVQMAASNSGGRPISPDSVRQWAKMLCKN
jgi:rhamnulokinase